MMELLWSKEGTMVAGRIPVTSEEVLVMVIYAVILLNQVDCFSNRDFKQIKLGFFYLQRKGKRRILDYQMEVLGVEVRDRRSFDDGVAVRAAGVANKFIGRRIDEWIGLEDEEIGQHQ
ncbi:unnamed protein product [Lactuca saligna]|uniref:Uncharacterized protein n=1 Tax=Lactuca saligna TaxID=75948 RepID=A0AA35VJQ8_LACSI|nr:unnamed protein product [Lactuca saligna]